MQLLPQFSKSKRRDLTKQEINSELGLFFSDFLKKSGKDKRKRQLNILENNLLRKLEGKPAVRFRTKRIFIGFRSFLDEFEK